MIFKYLIVKDDEELGLFNLDDVNFVRCPTLDQYAFYSANRNGIK